MKKMNFILLLIQSSHAGSLNQYGVINYTIFDFGIKTSSIVLLNWTGILHLIFSRITGNILSQVNIPPALKHVTHIN